MDREPTIIEYTNQRGDVRYQPALLGDEKLWKDSAGTVWDYHGEGYGRYGPKLYRSQKRATRVALRHSRRMARRTWEAPDGK